MAKLNAFVIISGNLLENKDVRRDLKGLQEKYYVEVCIGGGEQINRAFDEKGWENKFGPMGRICETLEQRKVCEDVLKNNQAIVQDSFSDDGIIARVAIPFSDNDDVLSPINGDHMIFQKYNGYDLILRFTTKEREKAKRAYFKKIEKACQAVGKGKLDKLKVVGF